MCPINETRSVFLPLFFPTLVSIQQIRTAWKRAKLRIMSITKRFREHVHKTASDFFTTSNCCYISEILAKNAYTVKMIHNPACTQIMKFIMYKLLLIIFPGKVIFHINMQLKLMLWIRTSAIILQDKPIRLINFSIVIKLSAMRLITLL